MYGVDSLEQLIGLLKSVTNKVGQFFELMDGWFGEVRRLPLPARIKLVKLGGDDATSWINTYGTLIQQGALQWYPEGEDAIIDAMELPPKQRLDTPAAEQETEQAADVTEGAAESAPTAHAGGQPVDVVVELEK